MRIKDYKFIRNSGYWPKYLWSMLKISLIKYYIQKQYNLVYKFQYIFTNIYNITLQYLMVSYHFNIIVGII